MTSSKTQLYLLIAINALAMALDLILWIRAVKMMRGFSWFVSQLLYPVCKTIILYPAMSVLVYRKSLSPKNFTFPKKKILVLAIMATTVNYGLAIGSSLVPDTLQAMLLKCGTITVMIQARVILKTRFRWTHVVGALLLTLAAIASVWGTQGGGKNDLLQIIIGCCILLACMILPRAIYTEKWMKESDLNPVYLRFWMSLFSCALGLALVPLAFVQISGDSPPIPFNARGISDYLSSALGCFAGYAQPQYQSADCDGSIPPWVVWVFEMAVNVTYDVTGAAISKYGSASTGAALGSCGMLATLGLMQIQSLTGEAPAKVTLANGLSVVAVFAGIALYGWFPEIPLDQYKGFAGSHQPQLKAIDTLDESEAEATRPLLDGTDGYPDVGSHLQEV